MATKEDTSKKRRPTKVWRIFHFRLRFEMNEDARKCRRGILEYCRDFVNASSGDEAAKCLQQLALLSPGDPLKRLQLHGLFRSLVAFAGNQTFRYRGNLLNERFEPASDTLIGKWLGLTPDQIRPMLTELASVGLIERVPLKLNGDIPAEAATPKKAAGGGKKADGRNRAEISGDAGKKRSPSRRKNDNKKTGRKENGKGKHVTSNAQEGQGEDEAKAPSTPPAAQPLEPKEADERGSRTCPPGIPSGSVANTTSLAAATRRLYTKLDPDCLDFALEIYTALRIPDGEMTREGRREIANFAVVWIEARANLPPPSLGQFRQRTIAKATEIGNNSHRYDKPPAKWREWVKWELKKRKAEQHGRAANAI